MITIRRVKGKLFWKERFKLAFKRCAWLKWLAACKRVENLGSIVWLQGSTKLCVDNLNMFEKYKLGVHCILIGPGNLKELAGYKKDMFF